ncbi:hypothetical protein [Methanolobus halotolerans]|uniref:Uncharacterized protein n=1 Tax=Methanolobus halotolerans TaxID=2052935 RepID=A0A4E0PZZ4_9EURY|nr:hypothetical protein [Methanolobus halotolerans]TGC09642.1 hypothetical protein CUN85_04560 [Methanolobus halotolerans]
MPENLHSSINQILEGKQLSISAITRELKEIGVNEHRLVMTGYLRALRDMKILDEVNIPPSKVYKMIDGKEDHPQADVYALIAREIKHFDQNVGLPLTVYVITSILDRPVFKEELLKMGFTSKNISDYLSRPGHMIRESRNENIREYISGITKIIIPPADPAYEADLMSSDIIKDANCLLVKMLRLSLDMSGLTPRTKRTTIADFG